MTEKKLKSIKNDKELLNYDGEYAVISSHEMKLKITEKPEFLFTVQSGIPTLDKAIEGFRDGELISISGPTKGGKTLLAQALTVAFCKQNYPSLWFSYEVNPRQLLSQFPELPCFYMPKILKQQAMDWIEERIRESFLKYHTRIVFIDHLHFLFDIAQSRNPSLDIGTIIRSLKTIANEGFLIFLLCHTSKGSSDGELSYENIRDSSFVSQESDSVLMIKRTPDEGITTAKLRVEFHRRTGVFNQVVYLMKERGLLYERIIEKRDEDQGFRKKRKEG